jgi:hypothetical protein
MNNEDEAGYKRFPDEVLLRILSFLSQDNFLNVRLVNRQWNEVSKEKSLWKKVSFQTSFSVDSFEDDLRDCTLWNVLVVMISW